MAFSTIYKTLFEVQIISDYHLPDAEAFHTLDTGETTADQMETLLRHGYNIKDELIIEPSRKCLDLLKGHRMVFKTSPTGFFVAVKVIEKLDGNTLVYEPAIPLTSDVRLTFHLRLRNPNFINYSNIRVRPNLNANFYFSNIDPNEGLVYPYLSLPPADYLGGRQYEMGEWVDNGAGQIYQASVNVGSSTGPGDPGWEDFNSPVRYATYRDQKLLPFKFPYSFTFEDTTPIFSADFELVSQMGTGGATISAGGTGQGPFKVYPLDFTEEPPGSYILQVSSPEGYADHKEILIDPQRYDSRDLGLIEIGHQAGLDDFRLLEDSGALRTEGGKLQPPVFCIAFRNRATYWQYFLHQSEDIGRVDDSNFEVFPADGYIVTNNPRLLTFAGVEISVRNVDNLEIPLMSPVNLMIKPRSDRVYSEVFVPKLKI